MISHLGIVFIVLQEISFASIHILCLNVAASGYLLAKYQQTFYETPPNQAKEAAYSTGVSGGFLQPNILATRYINSIAKATELVFFQPAGGRLDTGMCL